MRAWALAVIGDALRVVALLCLGASAGKQGSGSLDGLVRLQMPLIAPGPAPRKNSPTKKNRAPRRPLHRRYFVFCLALTTLSLALLSFASRQFRGHSHRHSPMFPRNPIRRTADPTPVPSECCALLDEFSAALSPALVVRAVDLQEQLLLVLSLPPPPPPQNRTLRAVHDALVASAAPLPAELGLACVVAPGTDDEERLRVRGFGATDSAAYVRCHLPTRRHAPLESITLLLHGRPEKGVSDPAGGSAEPLDARQESASLGADAERTQGLERAKAGDKAHRTAGNDEEAHSAVLIANGVQEGNAHNLLQSPETVDGGSFPGFPENAQTGARIGAMPQRPTRRHDTFLRSEARLDCGVPSGSSVERLVMESSVQAEGVHVFQTGLLWDMPRPRCVYAASVPSLNSRASPSLSWKARALRAGPKENTVICPRVPDASLSLWGRILSGRGAPQAQGEGPAMSKAEAEGASLSSNATDGDGQHGIPGQGSGRVRWLVSVTLEDSAGPLPSVAHFDPSEVAPPNWRKGPVHSACGVGKEGQQAEQRRKEFHLCSCSMVWDSAHVLHEWAQYHAWMGVEHFFLYDNNSDDNVQELALSLSRTLKKAAPLGGAHRWKGTHGPTGATGSQDREHLNKESGEMRGANQGNEAGQRGSKGHQALFQNWTSDEPVGISVRPWPWLKSQEHAFAHCLLQAAPRCDWIMFTDVDEYIFPFLAKVLTNRASLAQKRAEAGPFLHAWIHDTERRVCPWKTGQLALGSLDMVASGWTRHPEAGVSHSYVCREKKDKLGKVVVRPEFTTLGLQHRVHDFATNGRFMTNNFGAILYHYKYQAWEEYKKKFKRRASRKVEDWMSTAYRLGLTERGTIARDDGVVIRKDEPIPPRDWATRSCEVRDKKLANFVELVFGARRRFGVEFPWQNSVLHSKQVAWHTDATQFPWSVGLRHQSLGQYALL